MTKTSFHPTRLSFTEECESHRLVVNNTGGLIVSYMVDDLGSDLTPHNWVWTGQILLTHGRPSVSITFH